MLGRPGDGWFEDRFKRPGTGGVRYAVTFNEYRNTHEHGTANDEPTRSFPTISLIASFKDGKREISKKIILSRETRLLITVNLSGRFNYRINFDGPSLNDDPGRNSELDPFVSRGVERSRCHCPWSVLC